MDSAEPAPSASGDRISIKGLFGLRKLFNSLLFIVKADSFPEERLNGHMS